MKNIHKINGFIYITNNEEIKKGDFLIKDNCLYKWFDETKSKGKKVIITDNPNLIKEGIQEIPTDFLEWFVKNSECESVDTKLVSQRSHLMLNDWVNEDENGNFPISIAGAFCYRKIHKLIIPQDQPKQTIEEVADFDPKIRIEYNKTLENIAKNPNIKNGYKPDYISFGLGYIAKQTN